MRTIAELIRWRAQRHADLAATWFQGRTRTYGELDRSSSELAAGLVAKLGLEPGDRVAILDKNSDAYLELFFALDKAGLVAAPINRRLTAPEIRILIEDFAPKLIVAGEEFSAACAGLDVRSMRFEDGAVVVETGKPDAFYARVTELAASGEYGTIEEVTSPDDNLQAVFQYLVK